ncbi:Condensin complex subunit 1 [Bulinus truncatus]|nr:Condensin complex subunit 1 [Bulinus truncatus]
MEFIIPASKDDLLSRKDVRHYAVEDLLTVRQISTALKEYRSVCKSNSLAVAEHFDTLFSILCLQKDLDQTLIEEAWTLLIYGCQTFLDKLPFILDESDLSREERLNNLNGLKMSCYLLCQFMELFESIDTKPTTVAVKGKGKKTKSSNLTMDWNMEKQNGLQLLYGFLNLSLSKLWDPPVVEEEYISLVSSCCCKTLENPSTSKSRESIVLIAHIFGNLVQRYNHGLSMSLKIDQLLKHFEFLTSPLAQIVEIMVNEHRCKSTLTDLFREIGNSDNKDSSKDTTAAKAYGGFMVELSEKIPSVVLAYVPLVIKLLDDEPYTLRNGVLGMLGEILIKFLTKDNLDDKMRAARDNYFDKLKTHIIDVNAFVRSKVLQIWQNIITEGESLMTSVVGRLHDKSSIVRRHALQLVTALLKSNPFAAKLPVEDLKINYEKEKAILDQMTPEISSLVGSAVVDGEISQKWSILQKKLSSIMEEDEFLPKDKDISSLIADGENSDNVLSAIVKHLDNGEFLEALILTCAARESFPDIPVFSVPSAKEKTSDAEDEEMDVSCSNEENKTIADIKEIYFWVKCPVVTQALDESKEDQNNSDLIKQKTLVQYLKNSLTFAAQVQQCIPVICQLLGSKNTTDVLEAIQFFVTAVEFGVTAATVGVRKMMVLIWSQETSVREAVVNAYRTLYLEPKEKNQKTFAESVVKNLSSLFVGITFGDLMSYEALISQFVKSGHIGTSVIKVLWDRFTMKSKSVTSQDSRCAIHLIAMCAQAEPEIAKSNIELLVQEGLGPRGETDYLLAQGTCQVLLKLVPGSKEKGTLSSEPFRFEAEHSMFHHLKSILLKGVTDMGLHHWIPLADLAVTVIYKLCDTPGVVCVDLLRQLLVVLTETCKNEMQLAKDGGDESAKSTLVSCVLARVLSVAGQVAFRQTVFMEVDVLTEMKRLMALKEENKKGHRKSRGGNNSKASEMEEDMALAGASAEDTEAEYIRRLCELEILNEDNFLIKFCPLIHDVCSNSARFPDPDLQKEASLALARFMIINPKFCDSYLQLLFTLLEKSPSPVIRSNLIIALGDLTFRFPNLIEPWTSHLYGRLRDSSSDVRKTTLQVLSHLILNDMVKVKGQISELAICIVDHDEKISGLAKLFFHELAKKSNSMYNMPDIISRLSDPDIGVEQSHFQIIIKYIFSNIEKNKHSESLVEKLCHRFRGTRTDRQVQDLSFCLSHLSYSEKALAKLMENFTCFADKLVDPVVYNHFVQIISKSKQFLRQESKSCFAELESKIEQAHTKGLEGAAVEDHAVSRPSVCVKANNTRRKTKGQRKAALNKENIQESDEDVEINSQSPLKQRTTRGGRKSNKMRYTIDSSDDDDGFFDLGKEGQKEQDLDADDSLVTKPSQKKTRRGKVPLTPVYSPSA